MTFDEYWKRQYTAPDERQEQIAREAWEAATAAERERCCKLLEAADPPFDVPGFLADVIREGT